MHVLITPRLTMRPPAFPDADDIALWLSDPVVAHMLGQVPHPYETPDARLWIDRVRQRPRDLVHTIHRERLIGVVSIEDVGGAPRLGYWLAAPWHGRGFMTEAARRLLAHAFADRGLPAVRSSVFADNPASLRVQQKLGFAVTGRGDTWCRSRGETVPTWTTELTADAFAAAELEQRRKAAA